MLKRLLAALRQLRAPWTGITMAQRRPRPPAPGWRTSADAEGNVQILPGSR
jgi:hypothetical protein